MTTSVERVAVVATGSIGASWVSHFLAWGLEVAAVQYLTGGPTSVLRR